MDLSSGTWQGISGIVAIVSLVVQTGVTIWAARRQDKKDVDVAGARHGGPAVAAAERTGASLATRLIGAMLVWVTSYLGYALTWVLLAFAWNIYPAFLLSPEFTIMAVAPGTGALLVRSPFLGGALGGALGLLAIIFVPPKATLIAEQGVLTLLIVGPVLGAAFGAVASGGAVNLAQACGIPLPRGQLPQTDRPLRQRLLRYLIVADAIAIAVVLLVWHEH